MGTTVSRRALLIALGGGLATSVLCGFERFYPWPILVEPTENSGRPCCDYVDHQGWLLTTTDKERLTLQRQIRQIEDTDLPGGDVANKVVTDASACAAWCLSESRCRSFTFAKPEHPVAASRNMCWIKGSNRLGAVANRSYTSGVVD